MRLRPERGSFPISANRDLLSALVVKNILVTDFQGVGYSDGGARVRTRCSSVSRQTDSYVPAHSEVVKVAP